MGLNWGFALSMFRAERVEDMSVSQGSRIVLTSKTKKIIAAISLLVIIIMPGVVVYNMQSEDEVTSACLVEPIVNADGIEKTC